MHAQQQLMIDYIRTFLRNVLNWFRWTPSLTKPLPQRPSTITKPLETQNRITAKIISAKNIPSRKDARPLIELTLGKFSETTEISDIGGGVFEVPIEPLHSDYLNPLSLCDDIVFKINDAQNGGRLLGQVTIPLSALCHGYNLSGWFPVTNSMFLIGYDVETRSDIVSRSPRQQSADNTYLNLEISVQHALSYLQPNMDEIPSNDVLYIKTHVIKWNELFNSTFPTKKFNALVMDVNGRSTCLTRFLRPLEPPHLNHDEYPATPEQLLRYISLVPFAECNSFAQNIWLTSEQFLTFMCGTVVDHCVALVCFLMASNCDAYLVLGYGLPHGSTAYVLLCEFSASFTNYYIMDVFHGRKYEITDPFCPLQRIYCLANGQNIWACSQRCQTPAFLRFDLERRSDWWPLFNHKITAPTNFVNNKINYVSEEDLDILEISLNKKIKIKFSKWRPMQRTKFNVKISDLMKNALKYFEVNAMNGRSNFEALNDVLKSLQQYNVNGVVINEPFANIKGVVRKLKLMNLHVQNEEVTEFALSIYMQSYPGKVLSVWIFLGVILSDNGN